MPLPGETTGIAAKLAERQIHAQGDWFYLAALTLTRTCCAVQFQSVTLLLPLLEARLGFGPTTFGFLLGLYMAPGPLTAALTPWVTRRLGDQVCLQIALAVMIVGQLLLIYAPNLWNAAAGRLISGLGGCIVYIATVDLAARAGRAGPLPLRMGVIAASWPAGNAVALVLLGALAAAGLFEASGLAVIFIIVLASVMVAFSYCAGSPGIPAAHAASPRGRAVQWLDAFRANLLVGLSFATYNVAFVVLVSFSPAILQDVGYTRAEAALVASLPMWMFIASVPLGGYLAARYPAKQGGMVAAALLGSAAIVLGSVHVELREPIYLASGMLGGLPVGPMLARVERLSPEGEGHALGFSAFFVIFFIALLTVPALAGVIMDMSGTSDSILWLFAILSASAFMLFHASGKT